MATSGDSSVKSTMYSYHGPEPVATRYSLGCAAFAWCAAAITASARPGPPNASA